jgi:hypothetical protein
MTTIDSALVNELRTTFRGALLRTDEEGSKRPAACGTAPSTASPR